MGKRCYRSAILAIALAALVASIGVAREIVVTSVADSGTGTLRWAMGAAESGDTVTFDSKVFPAEAPATIYLRSELPPLDRGGVTLDGSDAGVIIDGSKVPGDWSNGIAIYSDHNVVRGLQIVHFRGSGIAICSGSYNTIGGDRRIGNGPLGQGNLSSGNGIGIDLCDSGTEHNHVTGNLVGPTADGQMWGNLDQGIWIEDGASNNVIGPYNVVAYNHGIGIDIYGGNACGNRITRNNIFQNGEAIRLRGGGNEELAEPWVASSKQETGIVAGKTCPGCTVEFFSDVGSDGFFYEGQATADGAGAFAFSKGAPLEGSVIVATATDEAGNTSGLSLPTGRPISMQAGNGSPARQLIPGTSERLADNRIGCMLPLLRWEDESAARSTASTINAVGDKWVRISFDLFDAADAIAMKAYSTEQVAEAQDTYLTALTERGVQVLYCLNYWDPGSANELERQLRNELRFRNADDKERYLDYVRFIVNATAGRVRYYEVLNEPTPNGVALDVYLDLARASVGLIRELAPRAGVVIGAITNTAYPIPRQYLLGIASSDIMSAVDGLSWHGMYGASPRADYLRDYYQMYPALVREIKQTARVHGFQGEFIVEEMVWRTIRNPNADEPWTYSETEAAKYYLRAIVMHLGLDVMAGYGGELVEQIPSIINPISRLCTVMAGHQAIDMPVDIRIAYGGPVAYCTFRYPNGDRMVAVWKDGVAQDEDAGVPATIVFPGLTAGGVVGIDVLYGFEQELGFGTDGGSTVVRDVLVRDYPVLIRLSDVELSPGYTETIGDSFHRLGESDAKEPERDRSTNRGSSGYED